ncbi:MAG: PVC-type heme-binding CxxCH protein, partial [Gemmataceae bacterium]
HDTHELPSALTFGPDGWLYGLNGVFNPSVIRHQGKENTFTCAMWRLHPITHEFLMFCEGTRNPYGIAIDTLGSAFVSACVIDHLWHLTETGYYLRQGGPYPPNTWILGSIVRHKHQKAAYCGIHWFDSDAYPPEYRERLYMGNIHGGCINADKIVRDGSTYSGSNCPDFLTANDQWFMPVSQKTGPDGSLWILDWYDQYHCYQDAKRDPAGIERLRGRLYRVRHESNRAEPWPRVNLGSEPDDRLIIRLAEGNGLWRETSQRLLAERLVGGKSQPSTRQALLDLVEKEGNLRTRLHAFWALLGGNLTGKILAPDDYLRLMDNPEAAIRAWAVRAAGNAATHHPGVRSKVVRLAADSSADVRLQVAITAGKLPGLEPMDSWMALLAKSADDSLLPAIIWQNARHRLQNQPEQRARVLSFLAASGEPTGAKDSFFTKLVTLTLADPKLNDEAITRLMESSQSASLGSGIRATLLRSLATRLESEGATSPKAASAKAARLLAGSQKMLEKMTQSATPLSEEGELAWFLLALAGVPEGSERAESDLKDGMKPESLRRRAFQALAITRPERAQAIALEQLARSGQTKDPFQTRLAAELARLEDPALAEKILAFQDSVPGQVRDALMDTLTQRPAWARQLFLAIEAKKVPSQAVGVNQVRRVLGFKDKVLSDLVQKSWGSLRADRDPGRDKLVKGVGEVIRAMPGDPVKGQAVFARSCGVCHKIYGSGQEVGPDLTSNGRASFEQLLSNIFDPNLVIGAAYQAHTVATTRGRVVSGLLVEDSKEKVVLKVQGGAVESFPRGEIETSERSAISLMPEGLEKQIPLPEIRDLIAFLCLDRPPTDPAARRIPGAP